MKRILLLCSFLLIFFTTSVSAVYTGNETYTDPNNTIFLSYNSIADDLINRIYNRSSSVDSVLNYFRNGSYNYYLYYGNVDGSSMVNASTIATNNLYIAFFSSDSPSTSSTLADNYQGIDTTFRQFNDCIIYHFNGNDLLPNDSGDVLIPNILATYKPSNLTNFLNNSSGDETDSIVNAINEQTNAINEQTNTIQETQDYLKNDTVEDSSINIIEDNNEDITASGFDSIFTTIYNRFTNYSTIPIVFPIPFTEKSIYLSPQYLKVMLGENSWILKILNTFWYFVVGYFIVKDIERIIEKVKSGDIATSCETNIKTDML